MLKYRGDYFGDGVARCSRRRCAEVGVSVGDRELMAAFVSKTNECEF